MGSVIWRTTNCQEVHVISKLLQECGWENLWFNEKESKANLKVHIYSCYLSTNNKKLCVILGSFCFTGTNHSVRHIRFSGWPSFYWKKCVYFLLVSNKTLVNIILSHSYGKHNAWYFWRSSFVTIFPSIWLGVNYKS